MPIKYEELIQDPHPEERATARVSKDKAETTQECGHPHGSSRRKSASSP
jgi:hypothetical protein